MAFLRTVSALSWLRSTGKHAVRRLQTLSSSDLDLHSQLKDIIPEQQEILRELRPRPRKVRRVLGSKWGMKGLLWDTSIIDSNKGIRFHGPSLPKYLEKLPAAKPEGEPLPEGLLWLLLTGKVPSKEQVDALSYELRSRATVPDYVFKAIDALPDTTHPMTQFASGVMALQVQSEFQKAYEKGIHQSKFWEPTYEDALNLIARLPLVAAYVYHRTFKGSQFIPKDDSLDYGANFSHMLGFDNPKMHELMRLYVTIHTDKYGGDVSAHIANLVGIAVSDPYLSFAAALNCLAGPLHGLANQEVLLWIKSALNECRENMSTKKLEEYAWKTLTIGKAVPSYGHGLLRKRNPRYAWLNDFAMKHLPEDPLFRLVSKLYELGPPFLTELREVKYLDPYGPRKMSPWPNVDAHSAVLLNHFGLTEARYYAVIFAFSSCIRFCSKLIWNRALSFE